MLGRMPLVELTLPRGDLARLAPLLQRGVDTHATAGVSAFAFLTGELGLEADYVRRRITTVFLDGQVVDDLEAAVLRDGAVLALSAAMPGLVGATLRRGGYYAAMRAAITHAREHPAPERARAVVRVKLFNLLLEEIGPVLLARGVLLGPEERAALPGAAAGEGGTAEVRVFLK